MIDDDNNEDDDDDDDDVFLHEKLPARYGGLKSHKHTQIHKQTNKQTRPLQSYKHLPKPYKYHYFSIDP